MPNDDTEEFMNTIGTQVRNDSNRYRQTDVVSFDEPPTGGPRPKQADITEVHAKAWAGDGTNFKGVSQTYSELPSGMYRPSATDMGIIFVKQLVSVDSLLELPDTAAQEIIEEFQKFWTLDGEFKSRGFLKKRGFLLFGPPGSGKTSCIQILVKKLIEDHNGLVIVLQHPGIMTAALQSFRTIESKRPIIVLIEDIDAIVEKYGENELLALLDGEAQVENLVFLATTNYPERLDKRFSDRPSRFDTIKKIGMPNDASRKMYLQLKEPSLKGQELDDWVEKSDGFSIAHLKEMIIAVRCFGQDLDTVVARLKKMHERRPSSHDDDISSIGFMSR